MSSIKYIDDIIQGCILITNIVIYTQNMKNLKLGCIPFTLETKIQSLLEWTYILIEDSEKLFSEIQEEKVDTPLINLFKTLLKQVLDYFNDRNKTQNEFTIVGKRRTIDQTIQQIQKSQIRVVSIPEQFSIYAENFRKHVEVMIYHLDIVVALFPLEE